MSGSNLAVLPTPMDGNDGTESPTFQVIIDTADNGFVMTVHGDDEKHKVYLFTAKGEDGPVGMIQDLINQLGISDKVKIQK